MPSDTALERLLLSLHGAPLRPELWGIFLDQLAAMHGVTKAALLVHDIPQGQHKIIASVGAAVAESQGPYETTYGQFDEWAKRAPTARFKSGVVRGEELYPDALLKRSVYFNEFLKPFGTCQMVCIGSADVSGACESLSVFRGPDEDSFSDEMIETLRLLVPHFRTALSVRHKLKELRGAAADFESALEALPMAIILLRRDGSCHFVNHAARRLLDHKDGLLEERGRLAAREPGESARLKQLVGSLIGRSSPRTSPRNAMLISKRKGRPLHVLGTSISREALPNATRASAMLIIADPDTKAAVPAEILGYLFGLTPAESRLATALANGLSLIEAADQHRVQHDTARKQLKAVFAKTHTNRQGELIRLVHSLVRPVDGH